MAKNQANANQHPEAELLKIWIWKSSFTLSSKNNGTYSKKISKRTNAFLFMRLYDKSWWNWTCKRKSSVIDKREIDLGLDIDTNIVNIKSVSVRLC